MGGIEAFLNSYGLLAIFGVMLVKAIGVPIPIPADVIMLATSARVAEGRLDVWQAFAVILVALIVGGVVQFGLARGLGRRVVYRLGRYIGLTQARLDAAGATLKKGGPVGIGLAIVTPGIRSATVAACGLAGLSLRTFAPGLTLGSTLFLSLHFFLGALIAPLIGAASRALTLPVLVAFIVVLLAAGLVIWIVIRRRQRPGAARGEVLAEALEAWHEATCPVCLALGAASRVATVSAQPSAREL